MGGGEKIMKLKSMQIKKEGGFEMKKTNKKALSSLAISIILLLQLFSYNVIALEDDTFFEAELMNEEVVAINGVSEETGNATNEENDEELMPIAATTIAAGWSGGWPGNDGSVSPGAGWSWTGPGAPGTSNGGAWVNCSGASLHPDLNHGPPKGAHWDYRDEHGRDFTIFPDGSVIPA